MGLSVAIIGSGPSGFYAADAILNTIPDCTIDLIERLPTPYGLVRGGVAPDHQSTKQVAKKFEKIAQDDRLLYLGNVEVGRDISLDEMRRLYDVVVLAIGAPSDRPLTIPGADKSGVFGAAAFVGWYNGHPDFVDLSPDLNTDAACVIGHGNVALDIGRLLVRSVAGRAQTDLPDYARQAMDTSPIRDVHLLGRRGPVEAKFTNVELREMLDLAEGVAVCDPAELPDDVPEGLDSRDARLAARNLETFKQFAANHSPVPQSDGKKRAHFRFYLQPVAVLGDDHVTGLRVERTNVVDGRATGTGDMIDIPCGLVVAAIGYRAGEIKGLPYDQGRGIIPNEHGCVDDGLYVVGWIKRGPSGVISSSRPDGIEVADHVTHAFAGGGSKPGRPDLLNVLEERDIRYITFADWKILDEEEENRADHSQPRQKFTEVEEMIAHLDEEAS